MSKRTKNSTRYSMGDSITGERVSAIESHAGGRYSDIGVSVHIEDRLVHLMGGNGCEDGWVTLDEAGVDRLVYVLMAAKMRMDGNG
jgi:hypothetical protein